MAILYPTLETINKLRQKPTEGELYLIDFLLSYLDDSFEIFFQLFLNGDLPDIILLRKGSGAYIIEVKDWNLKNYRYNNFSTWKVIDSRGEWNPIKSPSQQVSNYKSNLFNLHIEDLLRQKIKDQRLFSIVNCGCYFHNSSTQELLDFIDMEDDEKQHKYIDYFGRDNLEYTIKHILSNRWLGKHSKLFNDNLYNSFKRIFKPPMHMKEYGKEINYSPEQEKIIKLNFNADGKTLNLRQKIKGVAGCGKTLCLAKRAVNSHIRHQDKVLILTFNISLINYIHDKISEVRENFEWYYFNIINYHQFFLSQAENLGLEISDLNDFNNTNFFESKKVL